VFGLFRVLDAKARIPTFQGDHNFVAFS
jgi:hypothetical protein